MKLAPLIATLGLSLAVPGAAEQTLADVERFASPYCTDPITHQVTCILKIEALPLTEFYRGATPDQLLVWNERLIKLLEDTNGDGIHDTVPAFTHVQVQAPWPEAVAEDAEPDHFANARAKCAREGPHNCGRIGWARPVEEFITSNNIPFELFVRWNELPDAVDRTTELPEGAMVVVYDPTDDQV